MRALRIRSSSVYSLEKDAQRALYHTRSSSYVAIPEKNEKKCVTVSGGAGTSSRSVPSPQPVPAAGLLAGSGRPGNGNDIVPTAVAPEGRQSRAWGGAQRNPRTPTRAWEQAPEGRHRRRESVYRRAPAPRSNQAHMSPRRGSPGLLTDGSWGSATLHPRLYYAGPPGLCTALHFDHRNRRQMRARP